MYQPHLEFAHQQWKKLVIPGDLVIDATCGNGQDTLFLAQLALLNPSGKLFAYDIQETAIQKTEHLLKDLLSPQQMSQVTLIQRCHSQFSTEILSKSVRLIVYNLGYLPKGNKQITTQVATTLKSLTEAQNLVMPGGLISITCYPGHPEGEKEEKALLDYAQNLNLAQWHCSHHRWINKPKAPSVLLINKLD